MSPRRISVFPITHALYVAVTAKPTPSDFSSGTDAPNRPVEMVSRYDASVFCNMPSMAEGRAPVYTISGSTKPPDWGTVPSEWDDPARVEWDAATMNLAADGYRLPTEAEWMWAAMGATSGHDYPRSVVYTTGYLKALAGSKRVEQHQRLRVVLVKFAQQNTYSRDEASERAWAVRQERESVGVDVELVRVVPSRTALGPDRA